MTIDYTVTNNAAAVAVDFIMPVTWTSPDWPCAGVAKTDLAKSSTTTGTCRYFTAGNPPASLTVTAVATALGLAPITFTSTAYLLNLQVLVTAPLTYNSRGE